MKELLPAEDKNNLWYSLNSESDTVFVFVHGIFSNSRQCWWYQDDQDSSNDRYWPELLKKDSRFENPSIYLGGFYTARDSGSYGLSDCSRELWRGIREPTEGNERVKVLDKANIIFIGHSTGGIVIRHMLDEHYEEFQDKNVGLVLMASPSLGSEWADWLSWLADYFDNKLTKQLQWDNTSLSELDDRFKDLVDQKKIPGLIGTEAYENRFIIHVDGGPPLQTKVVQKISAGRYFGSPTQIANTDHFSIIKPNGKDHPSHKFLVDFYTNKFESRSIPAPPRSFLLSFLISLNGQSPPPDGSVTVIDPAAAGTANGAFMLSEVPRPQTAIPFTHAGKYDFLYSIVTFRRPSGVPLQQQNSISPAAYQKRVDLDASADPIPIPFTDMDRIRNLQNGVRRRIDQQ